MISLGTAWVLDGLEITLAGSAARVLTSTPSSKPRPVSAAA
ncbi:MAG TPA: hypothetical protein VK162_12625 [Streptosporangiaceae bacterium]|nr:hypothetical protein [Streptosporangiaceae bacterium]